MSTHGRLGFGIAFAVIFLSTLAFGQGTTPPPPSGVQAIFTASCALGGCHAGSTPASGLNLEAANAASNLVGVASREKPDLKRVDPGKPDASYLIHKVEGRAGITGARMPLNRTPLAADQVKTITDWIAGLGQTQPPATVVAIHLVSFKVDGTALRPGVKTAPVTAGKHRFELAFDAPLQFLGDPRTGDIQMEGVEVRIFPNLANPPADAGPTADGKGFAGTVDLPPNATYQLVVATDTETDSTTFTEFYFGTAVLPDAGVSGTIILPDGATNTGFGAAFLLSHPLEEILGSGASAKLARAAKRVAARLAQTDAGPDSIGSDPYFEDLLLSATVRIDFLSPGNPSFGLPFVPDGTYYLAAVTDVQAGDERTGAFGVFDADGDGTSDSLAVRSGRSVTGLQIAMHLDTPEPPTGGALHLVSFKVDSTILPAGVKTPPFSAGPHRFEIRFDAPLQFLSDPQGGDVQIEGVDLRIFPAFAGPANIAPTADGRGFGGTIDLPAAATYQLVIVTNPETADQVITPFFFGTTAFSDARVSGAVTLPGGATNLGNGYVLLLSKSLESITGSGTSSTGLGQDILDRLVSAAVRATPIHSDLSFHLPYVPDGKYYLGAFIDVQSGETSGKATGVFDLNGDGASDSLVVKGGQSVTGLKIATRLGSSTSPPPSGGGATLTPKPGNGSGMLDLDTASGDQQVQTKYGLKAGDRIDVQVLYGKETAGATGFQAVLGFDPKKVSVSGGKGDGVFASAIFPGGPQVKADSVTYAGSFLGSTTTAKGSVAILTFQTASGFSGDTEILLKSLMIRAGGTGTTYQPGASVVLTSSSGGKPTPDFDGSGEVDFNDFFLFAVAFGKAKGDPGFDPKYDLDGSGEVDFNDFFLFASAFGTTVGK